MSNQKIHFSYEPDKEAVHLFAQKLIQNLGQARFEDADVVVTVGGDGSLLHAFRAAQDGQRIFGIVPPGSNSRGFWVNRKINDAEELQAGLSMAGEYEIHPLKASIYHSSGRKKLITAFNEVSPSEYSGQAMLVEVCVKFPRGGIGPIRIMGDGLIFSTAFGSTALSGTYDGPAIDIRNSGITMTGKGIYEPKRGFSPIIANDNMHFDIKFISPGKRPVRIQYDGLSEHSPENDPFERMEIRKDKKHAVKLMLTDDPATRAFSTIMP